MGDDNLFPAGEAGKGDEGGGKPETVVHKAEVDRAELKAIAEETFGPLAGEMAGALKHISGELEGLKAKQTEKISAEDAERAKMEALLSDPEKMIDERVRKEVAETTGPLFHTLLRDSQDRFERTQKVAIEDEFGEGVWEEFFKEPVADMLKTFPAKLRGEEAGYAAAVNQVKGSMYSDLKGKAKEAEKVKAEKAKARDFQVLPDGRAVPPKGHLNDDEEKYLAALNDHGFAAKKEDYLASKGMGNTLDDYLKATKKEGWLNGS